MEHSDILGAHQSTASPPDAIQQLGTLVGVGLALNPKRKEARLQWNGNLYHVELVERTQSQNL